jgi:hypothetical protein
VNVLLTHQHRTEQRTFLLVLPPVLYSQLCSSIIERPGTNATCICCYGATWLSFSFPCEFEIHVVFNCLRFFTPRWSFRATDAAADFCCPRLFQPFASTVLTFLMASCIVCWAKRTVRLLNSLVCPVSAIASKNLSRLLANTASCQPCWCHTCIHKTIKKITFRKHETDAV